MSVATVKINRTTLHRLHRAMRDYTFNLPAFQCLSDNERAATRASLSKSASTLDNMRQALPMDGHISIKVKI